MHLIFFSVEFEDLWKFHAPVNIVQGFDVSLFDELIEVRIFLGYHLV